MDAVSGACTLAESTACTIAVPIVCPRVVSVVCLRVLLVVCPMASAGWSASPINPKKRNNVRLKAGELLCRDTVYMVACIGGVNGAC